MQSAPARGRQPSCPRKVSSHSTSCNLHPRGDGNMECYQRSWSSMGCNLHPRGDGNSTLERDIGKCLIVAICTREGTATSLAVLSRVFINCCNLHPRGDGNMDCLKILPAKNLLQSAPARGRQLLKYHSLW